MKAGLGGDGACVVCRKRVCGPLAPRSRSLPPQHQSALLQRFIQKLAFYDITRGMSGGCGNQDHRHLCVYLLGIGGLMLLPCLFS